MRQEVFFSEMIILFFLVGMRELAVFWSRFRRADRKLVGFLSPERFWWAFGEKRSLLCDGVFELLDADVKSDIDFGRFMQAVTTYCLFEPEEILRFCFFVFDRDKTGFLEANDVQLLFRILHRVPAHEDLRGNLRNALNKMDTSKDGKVDFQDFKALYERFPALFDPAFRLQTKMMRKTMGKTWWDTKKRSLYDDKVQKELLDTREERIELKRRKDVREIRVKKKMGSCRYYLCCRSQRNLYRSLFPLDDDLQDLDDPKLKEKKQLQKEKKDAKAKEKQRHIDNQLRHLQEQFTPAWRKRKKKHQEEQGPTQENLAPQSSYSSAAAAHPSFSGGGGEEETSRPPRRTASERQERARARRVPKVAAATMGGDTT